MGENGLGDLEAALGSHDWTRVRDAVDELGARLRAGSVPSPGLPDVARRLVALATHAKWEVRKAVAHALEHVPNEPFHAGIARLLEDENAWVQEAARRALGRRTELTRAEIAGKHEELLDDWLADVEARYGAQVRDAALEVSGKYTELLVRETYHEVVRVLSPLELALARLEKELREPKIAKTRCLASVKRARDRLKLLGAIVRSLRELTMQVTPELRGEGLKDLVKESIALVRDRRARRAKKLTVKLEIDAALVVEAHRHRLVQAFANVIENAVDSFRGLRRAPKLRITARARGPEILITFVDQGCGMSDEAVRDAFRLFSTSKPDGAGIGLPLAQKIVQMEHRGRMWIESRKDEGTTVTIALPLEKERGE